MMIAKTTKATSGKSSFTALAHYILQEQKLADGTAKIQYQQFTNCQALPEEMDAAVTEIKHTQALNQQTASAKTYHLIVSFLPGEIPTKAQLDDIESTLAESIGYENHQRISAVHTDTSHLHIHIAINKIHPETLRAITPRRDYNRLYAACRELETKHGLTPLHNRPLPEPQVMRDAIALALLTPQATWQTLHEALKKIGLVVVPRGRGLQIKGKNEDATIKPSELAREYSRAGLEKILGAYTPAGSNPVGISAAAATIEQCSKIESFQSWAIRALETPMLSVLAEEHSTWSQMHAVLATHGLVIVPAGRGLLITDPAGKLKIKPSQISRTLSRAKLEAVMGAYAPAKDKGAKTETKQCPYRRRPTDTTNVGAALWQTYQNEANAKKEVRRAKFAEWRDARRQRHDDLVGRYGGVAARLWRGADKPPAATAYEIWKPIKAERARAYQKMRDDMVAMRDAIESAAPSAPSWRDWLLLEAKKGTPGAAAALARARVPKDCIGFITPEGRPLFIPKNHRELLAEIAAAQIPDDQKERLRAGLGRPATSGVPEVALWQKIETPEAASASAVARAQAAEPHGARYRISPNGDLLYRGAVLVRDDVLYAHREAAQSVEMTNHLLQALEKNSRKRGRAEGSA